MELEILIQLAGVLLTVGSAIVSVFAAAQTRRDIKLQRTLELLAVEQDYYRDLRQWADRSIELLTEAIFVGRIDTSTVERNAYLDRISECQQNLSALVEQGRLFLPNEQVEGFGKEKPVAYQGFRSPVLDPLVEAYHLLTELDSEEHDYPDARVADDFWELRKIFVSHIQTMLDPRTRSQMIAGLRRAHSEQAAVHTS